MLKIQLVRQASLAKASTPCALTIGNFDGLHLGHQQIIQRLVKQAEHWGLIPTVVTFEPLPLTVLRPEISIIRLTPLAEKIKRLAQWGVKQVVCLRFNQALAHLSARDFMINYLIKLKPRFLVVGSDFRFGCQKQGDVHLLQSMAQQFHFVLETIDVCAPKISSTTIRQALLKGDVEYAATLLGSAYSITQRVIKGRQLGRELGFPTANLVLKKKSLQGVFITRTTVDEKVYDSLTNMGVRPSIDGKSYLAETHLLDFTGNLYGKKICVKFLHKIRDEKHFAQIEDLRRQIVKDVQRARHYFDKVNYERL